MQATDADEDEEARDEVRAPLKLMSFGASNNNATTTTTTTTEDEDGTTITTTTTTQFNSVWVAAMDSNDRASSSMMRRNSSDAGGSNRHLSRRASLTNRRASLTTTSKHLHPYHLPPQFPRVHILDRADLPQRALQAGMVRLQVELAPTLLHPSRRQVWRDRFLFVDRTLGLLLFPSKDAFERRDKKQLEILFYRDIARVTRGGDDDDAHKEDEFVLLIKFRAQSRVGRQEIRFQATAPGSSSTAHHGHHHDHGPPSEDAIDAAKDFTQHIMDKIQIVASVFTVGLNGEFPENAVCGAKPNVAVCFSGGGGRAHVCASGQMRALHYLGLLHKDKTDYLTGVSAGAWATGIYTFYQDSAEASGVKDDDSLFGPLLSVDAQGSDSAALCNWSMPALHEHAVAPMLQPCLDNAVTVARDLMFNVSARQLWERVLGRIFLRPFGLDEPHPYCLREELDRIKRKNPQLESVKFFTPRTASRPFWMCHGSIIGPTWAKIGDMLPIQFSALYVGSPYLHKIHYSSSDRVRRRRRSSILSKVKSADIWVGGGMVSPFVFGCDEPHSLLKKSEKPAPLKRTDTNQKSAGSGGGGVTSSWYFGSSSSSSKKTTTKEEVTSTDNTATTTTTTTTTTTSATTTNSVIFASLMREMDKEPVAAAPVAAAAAAAPAAHRRLHWPSRSASVSSPPSATTPAAAPASPPRRPSSSFRLKPGTLQRAASDVQDAIDTLQLAPGMIERVFKYAQTALARPHRRAESIASAAAAAVGDGVYTREVGLPFPEKPFSLRHTVGISSDAPSVNLHDRSLFNRLNVQENYWSPVYSPPESCGNKEPGMREVEKNAELDVTRQVAMDMGDGGSLDNLGLCAMLQRRVRRIVVFSNSSVCVPAPRGRGREGEGEELSPELKRHVQHIGTVRRLTAQEKLGVEDPADDRAPTFEEWPDDDLLPLFGQAIDDSALNYLGTHHEHNHVFPLEELRPLLRKFQSKLEQGEPIVVRQTHRVQENAYWGIEGGWDVDVLWVYLDESRLFREMLPEDTRKEMDRLQYGEFARFPNFRTFGNNSSGGLSMIDISLTPRQINLLSAYTEWQVMRNRELFSEFIDSANMAPLKRQRRQADSTVNQLEKEGFC